MMQCINFEITLVSAQNLPNVRSYREMKVYAEVLINGEPATNAKTNADMYGETNPRWNFPINYTINESSIEGLEAVVKLYCKRTLGDREIGEVKIPLKSLLDSGLRAVNELSYPVAVAGTRYGRLNILYSFGDMFLAPKPSAWKKALEIGIVVMIKGTWCLTVS